LARGRPRPLANLIVARGGRRFPGLLLTPGLGGTVIPLLHVRSAIAPARRCVGFTARGVDDGREPLTCVEAMAAVHVEEAISAHPGGPFRIAGWSFGALVAFEMGVQLRREGHDAAVILLDPLALLDAHGALPTEDAAGSPDHRRLVAAHALARARYRPGSFDGPVALFRAATASPEAEATAALGWDHLAVRSLEVQRSPGDHRSMLAPPHAAALAASILSFLDRLEG
jgi:thioesterase domain-containing protein